MLPVAGYPLLSQELYPALDILYNLISTVNWLQQVIIMM